MSKTRIYDKFNTPKIPGLSIDPKDARVMVDFKEECDINTIVKRYADTGMWSNSLKPATAKPMFGDFTSVPDFVQAQNIIVAAKNQFDALPAEVRKRFNNDPAQLLEFVSSEKNLDEAIRLGICNPRPETPPAGSPPAGVPDGSPKS